MSRLRAALTTAALVAGALGTGPAQAHEDHVHELPAAGCFTIKDDVGDAHLNSQTAVPNDPDLDIVGVAMRTTATSLQTYIKVSNLENGPSTTDGHRFFVDFTFNGHVFSMASSHYKVGTGAVRDGLAQTGQAAKVTQLGVDVPTIDEPATDKGFKASGLKATFDITQDWLQLDLPLADIGKYGGKAFTGAITGILVRSAVDNYAVGTIADSAEGGKWTIGDNKCWSTPTKLTLSVTRYPSQRTVTARLVTSAGQALGGQTLTYYVNGKKYAVTRTNGTGTASVRGIKPGSTVKVEFAPVGSYAGSSASAKV